ncbi:hypothetical protein D4S03_05680 [bacterium]|nr:MAG: hypothetical protein D4S03_05680 [bacterium]
MQIGEGICCQQEVNTSFAEGVGEKYEESTPFLNLNVRTSLICGDKRIFMENGLHNGLQLTAALFLLSARS